MLSYELFHPDQVVPAVELVAALMEFSHHAVSKVFMEFGAVFGEMFIFVIRVSDADVNV